MNEIRKQLDKPLIVGLVGFFIGAIFGLVILGWGLWPVKWVDAGPVDLRADAKVDYLRMVVESFSVKPDASRAQSRWNELQPGADQVLQQLSKSEPSFLGAITKFQEAINTPIVMETKPASGGGVNAYLIIGGLCGVIIFVVVAVAGFLFLRKKQSGGAGVSSGRRTGQAVQQQESEEDLESYSGYPTSEQRARPVDYRAAAAPTGERLHIANYMSTYTLGDDLFDDMFSLDAPSSGDFYGECGVGISDTIGSGDPKKVSALEVWLFDKNDTETVTRVITSKYAFSDPATRQKLLAKGELLSAEPGMQTLLETDSLIMTARIVDMAYGDGALPASSFFERITLELSIDRK